MDVKAGGWEGMERIHEAQAVVNTVMNLQVPEFLAQLSYQQLI